MRLAFILGAGEKVTKTLDSRIKGLRDNINTSYFSSVDKMMEFSIQRNFIFDRIVVVSQLLNSQVLIQDLYTYWARTNTDTDIVLVAKKNSDEKLCEYFMSTFSTPVVACMLLESTSLQTLGEAVLLSPSDLSSKYGIDGGLSIKTNEGFEYVPDVKEEEVKNEEPKPIEQPKVQQKVKEPKKKGFLSGLFGGKKKDKPNTDVSLQPQVTDKPQEELYKNQGYDSQEEYQDYNMQEYDTQDMNQNYNTQDVDQNYDTQEPENQFEEYTEQNESENQFEEYTEQNESENQFEENTADFNNEENIEDNAFSNISPTDELSFDEVYEDEENNIIPDTEEADISSITDEESQVENEISNVDEPEQSPVEEIQEEFDFSESYISEEEPIVNTTPSVENVESVDADFGNFTISYDENNTEVQQAEEVSDDLDLSSAGSAEESYRQANEQPKVVVKEVVKEVVRDVGGSIDKKHAALKAVVTGRNKKVIIVTGDRGSGITSSCLALAKTMAQKVKVLYVDLDTDNHGLLSYIDYDTFRNYGGTPQQGVKMCKSSKIFSNCIVSYEHNLDILTSDYSCDVADEEIERTQGVITEIVDAYNVIIVDCPMSKLHLISDLILLGNTILCVEESKRGFMNMLCAMENNTLSPKYKRIIASRGNMFLTKCLAKTDTKRLLKYINAIFESDTVDWMSMDIIKFNGKFSDDTLNRIFES